MLTWILVGLGCFVVVVIGVMVWAVCAVGGESDEAWARLCSEELQEVQR